MNDKEFEDLIYDMWYPDETRQQEAQNKYILMEQAEKVSLLKRVLQTELDGLIWRAVLLLMNDDPTLHLTAILPLFNSPASDVRFAIATVFADRGFEGALPELTRLAKSDPNGRVRHRAIAALGKCGDLETVKELLLVADSDDTDGDGRLLSNVANASIAQIRSRGIPPG